MDSRWPGAHDADLGRLALGAAHRVERGTWQLYRGRKTEVNLKYTYPLKRISCLSK